MTSVESDEIGRLAEWFGQQMSDADHVCIDGRERLDFGHSAEMSVLRLVVTSGGEESVREVVVKLRPPSPGLLEPYDLGRQFTILRALEPTPVRAPRALWHEPTGTVLGREFYVMERAVGDAYEREIPPELDADPELIPRMLRSVIDQLAEVHRVDVEATGLDELGDGATQIDRDLAHWIEEMRRVQLGPLPALERLLDEVRRQRPEPTDQVTLVHGDPKPGNFGFTAGEVTAVFDWELTDVGDPMMDIGYLELMWGYPVGLPSRPTAPTFDDVLSRYEERSGIAVHDRPWYLAVQAFRTSVILLVGSMLFEAGHSDDMRYIEMAFGIDLTTQAGLRALGIDEAIEPGPVFPSTARIEAAEARLVARAQ